MPAPFLILLLPVASFVLTLVATGLVIPIMTRIALDQPNQRSSHSAPIPRGGGIGLLAGLLPSLTVAYLLPGGVADTLYATLLAAALALALVSFVDDVRGLPPFPRLALQLVAVSSVLVQIPSSDLVFQGILPPLADHLLAGLAWLWFINLFNFMDGIDGLSGVEAATIGLGVALVAWLAGTYREIGSGLALAGASLAFLRWNWHPARIFLGDVGSIPIGFLAGWLLLRLAIDGSWAPALILPAYYLADATLTLLTRLINGEKIWQPHRSHFYQRAVQAGLSHREVAQRVAETNLLLVFLSYFAATGLPFLALGVAAAAVAIRLHGLAKPAIQPV